MKKYLALVLVLVMALGLFAACGTEQPAGTTAPKGTEPAGTTAPAPTEPQPKDPVTLVWHIRGVGTQTDHAKVEAEFNKLLQSKPGFEHITVKLMHNVAGEHKATVERAYTAKEQIDIVCTVNLDPVQMARDGYFEGLSKYFENHKTLWETYPEWLWETQYVDDDYYVVPNYQRGHNPKLWILDSKYKDIVDWAGFCELVKWENGYAKGTLTQILDKMEEMYLAIKATGVENLYLGHPFGLFTGYSQNMYWHEYLENLTPSKGGVYADHNTAKVDSLWLSEEWKICWQYACKWADAGYFPIDGSTADPGTYDFGKGKNNYFITHTQAMDWDEAQMDVWAEQVYGIECEVFRHVDKVYMENRWAASGNAVSSTCENPEDAVAFLELLGSKDGVDLYNMLVYGLEGVHYEWVNKETNQIKTLQYDGSQASGEAPYGMLKWCVGNTFNAYLNQACTLTENASALYVNENGVPAPWAGMKIDLIDVKTQQDNCSAVYTEWNTRMTYGQDGVAGFEAAYAEFIAAMKAAGVQDIIDTCQEQIDDYIASRK